MNKLSFFSLRHCVLQRSGHPSDLLDCPFLVLGSLQLKTALQRWSQCCTEGNNQSTWLLWFCSYREVWPWAAGYTADLWSAFVYQYPQVVLDCLLFNPLPSLYYCMHGVNSIQDANPLTFSFAQFHYVLSAHFSGLPISPWISSNLLISFPSL